MSSGRLFSFLIFCGFMVILFLKLGFWQLDRLAWKEDLLQQMTARLSQSFTIEEILKNPQDTVYGTVALSGQFLDISPLLMPGKKSRTGELGSHLLIPFRTDQGIVLVNRGWIPKNTSPRHFHSAEKIIIQGRIRQEDPRGPFTPSPDPEKNQWYTYDLALIEGYLKIDLLPFILEELENSSTSLEKIEKFQSMMPPIPNNHLQYALTWFAFALTTSIMCGIYVLRRKKGS